MFIDASALCAILLSEPEAGVFQLRIVDAEVAVTSPVAVWETVRALVCEAELDTTSAHQMVSRFLLGARVDVVEITQADGNEAVSAFARFGKGRHPARLNMGDCFAYACAKSRGVPLLYKGEDFARTDIVAA